MVQFIFPSNLGRGQVACGVYKIIFDSGAFYIGSSVHLKQRLWNWKFRMNSGIFKNYKVADEFAKTHKVVFEVLEFVEDPVMRRYREDLHIKLNFGNPLFLNSAPNAFNGAGAKKIIRKKKYGNPSQFKPVAKVNDIGEIIEKYESVADAERQNNVKKIYECLINNRRKVGGMVFRYLDETGNIIPAPTVPLQKSGKRKGFKFSEEMKEKWRQKRLLRVSSPDYIPPALPKHSKKMSQYTVDGEFIKTHDSIAAAAKIVGAEPRNFKRQIKKSPRNYYKGYIFKYA